MKCKFIAENVLYRDQIICAAKLQGAGHTSDATHGMKNLTKKTELKKLPAFAMSSDDLS